MIRRVLQIVLPLVALALAGLCASWLLHHRKTVVAMPAERFRPRIVLMPAKTSDYHPVIRSQGTVTPRTEMGLTPEVSGRVQWASEALVVGGHFAKGDPLVRLDDTDYTLAMAGSRAAMTNAVAQMTQASARFELESAEAEAARAEWKLLGKSGEPPALSLRQPQLKEARAAFNAARAGYDSGLAALTQASNNVARCELKAPFTGRVAAKTVVAGHFAAAGMVLARLQPVDIAEVRLPLALGDFQHLELPNAFAGGTNVVDGPLVTLRATHAGATGQWQGRIIRTEGEVNPGTRMMSVVVALPDPYGRELGATNAVLSFGGFVRAEILARPLRNVVVLPATALRESKTGDEVYLLSGTNQLRARPVKVAWRARHEVAIGEGLQAGDQVCLSELETFEDGMEVIIVPPSKMEPAP